MKKISSIHPHCQQCLKEHARDWYIKNGKVYCRDKENRGDTHICNLIHEEIQTSEESKKLFGEGELEFANFLYNPTLWTRTEFGWNSRWYQDLMLKCTAFRKVSRIGRRAGKTEAICIKMLHSNDQEDLHSEKKSIG
jgi:hypothetical protein